MSRGPSAGPGLPAPATPSPDASAWPILVPSARPLAGSAVPVSRRGPLVVHASLLPGAVPGWMVVAPLRHVEAIDALTREEQAALMPLVAQVAAALREETATEKVYVAVFSEVVPHVHVHVIARPPDLPPADRGPRIFGAAPPVEARQAQDVAGRVLARLEGTAAGPVAGRGRSPALRAALLSALVCPGVGQIRNRQLAKGLILIGLTLATAGYLLVRMLTEVLRLVPTDGTAVDPMAAWDMASEIQARNRERSARSRWCCWSSGSSAPWTPGSEPGPLSADASGPGRWPPRAGRLKTNRTKWPANRH